MTLNDTINDALQSSQEMQKIQSNLQLSAVLSSYLAKGDYCAALALLNSIGGSPNKLKIFYIQIEQSLAERIENTKIELARAAIQYRPDNLTVQTMANVLMPSTEYAVHVQNLKGRIGRLEELKQLCAPQSPTEKTL